MIRGCAMAAVLLGHCTSGLFPTRQLPSPGNGVRPARRFATDRKKCGGKTSVCHDKNHSPLSIFPLCHRPSTPIIPRSEAPVDSAVAPPILLAENHDVQREIGVEDEVEM